LITTPIRVHLHRFLLKVLIFWRPGASGLSQEDPQNLWEKLPNSGDRFQLGEVPVSFQNPMLLEVLDRQNVAWRMAQGSN
jgi:hypothetical protein